MAWPLRTLKKVGAMLLLGLLPVLLFLIGIILRFPLFQTLWFVLLAALLLIVFVYKITDSPFLRVFEGKEFGTLVIDSLGKIDFFGVELINGNFEGDYGGQPIRIPFNRKFFFYFSSFFGKGQAKENQEKIVLELEKKEFNQMLFKTDYPFLIYSQKLKSFITKEYLHGEERKAMYVALGYEVNRNLVEANRNASSITRMIVNLIGSKLKKQSWLLWIVLIIIFAYVLWQFGPRIQETLLGSAQKAVESAAGTPLPEKLG